MTPDPTPTPTSDALKPCPFCGSDPILSRPHSGVSMVYCPAFNVGCLCPSTGWCDDKDESAVIRWNRRAAERGREAERCQTHGAKIIGPCGMCGAPQCCPVCCEIAREQGKRMTAEEQRDKLAKFKAYVHKRLDTEGVPENPERAATAKHGCRIGDRFDWLFAKLRAPAPAAAGADALIELLRLADRAEACSGERPSPSHISDFRDIARCIRDEVGRLSKAAPGEVTITPDMVNAALDEFYGGGWREYSDSPDTRARFSVMRDALAAALAAARKGQR